MKKYYSKLLLFGEYTIIKGSAGLAIPYPAYFGEWIFDSFPNTSNDALKAWYVYLTKQEVPSELGIELNLTQFKEDLDNGLTFSSNIPLGYGVGSSGALTVAFFDKYVTDFHMSKKNIFKLKSIFIWLESFFHGGGSGIDPLVVYLEQPLLIEPNGNLRIVELPKFPQESNFALFLIDTKIPRNTASFVNIFHQNYKDDFYKRKIKTLGSRNDILIKGFLENKRSVLMQHFELLSMSQSGIFEQMIPNAFKELWEESLNHHIFSLKLCGAGGGGFILGFTKDWKKTQELLTDYDLELVMYL